MEKQKLSQLILARLKEKKEEEERTRPHYEVLKLQAVFAFENNRSMKQEIADLGTILLRQKEKLSSLEQYTQDLDNTGKRVYPRILIKPEFVASQKIQSKVKEFYRKSANTYLRCQIIRKQEYEKALKSEQTYIQKLKLISQLQKCITAQKQTLVKNTNKRRLAILIKQLEQKRLLQEQEQIKKQIEFDESNNREAISEYSIKRQLVEKSSDRIRVINEKIGYYRDKIEENFNPAAYRQFLEKSFSLKHKNQVLKNNLNILRLEIQSLTANQKQSKKKINQKISENKQTHNPSMISLKRDTRRTKTEAISIDRTKRTSYTRSEFLAEFQPSQKGRQYTKY